MGTVHRTTDESVIRSQRVGFKSEIIQKMSCQRGTMKKSERKSPWLLEKFHSWVIWFKFFGLGSFSHKLTLSQIRVIIFQFTILTFFAAWGGRDLL